MKCLSYFFRWGNSPRGVITMSAQVPEWLQRQWKRCFNASVEWLCKITEPWWNKGFTFNTLFWLLSVRFESKPRKERSSAASCALACWERQKLPRNLQLLLLRYIVPTYHKDAAQYSWCNRAVAIVPTELDKWYQSWHKVMLETQGNCFFPVWRRNSKFCSVHVLVISWMRC